MPGRKRTGEWRKCQGCGKDIYVRKHRLGSESQGNNCLQCFRKFVLPRTADGKRGIIRSVNVVPVKVFTREEFFHNPERVCSRKGKTIVMACIPCGLEAKYKHGEEIACKCCGCQFAIRIG